MGRSRRHLAGNRVLTEASESLGTDMLGRPARAIVMKEGVYERRRPEAIQPENEAPHADIQALLDSQTEPATRDEVQAAALQYVRKVSGTTRPSQANAAAFDEAVAEVAEATRRLLDRLVTSAPAKDREVEAAKARARAAVRYG